MINGRDFRSLEGALVFILTAIAILTGLTGASAHSRSQSYSTWRIEGAKVSVVYTIGAREVTRLSTIEPESASLTDLLVLHLAPRLTVTHADGSPCETIAGPSALNTREGFLGVEWAFDCTGAKQLKLQNGGFFDVALGHVNFARIDFENEDLTEVMFAVDSRSHIVDLEAGGIVTSAIATFSSYLKLGIEHILVGVDHIAFLIVLLLLVRRPRDVLLIVTGFTLGHSLTLSLAALGLLEPDVPVVESLIGFTIALVALENVGASTGMTHRFAVISAIALSIMALGAGFSGIGPPWFSLLGLAIFSYCYLTLVHTSDQAIRLRPVITVMFGLIHGFGFANVLNEIGLPTGRLVQALFGFNLGVELGQILVVLALAVLSFGVTRFLPASRNRLVLDALSAVFFAVGLYWFVGRALQIA